MFYLEVNALNQSAIHLYRTVFIPIIGNEEEILSREI